MTPRFQHVVLFNCVAATDEDDQRYNLLVADLITIPGVLSVTGGRINSGDADCTHALVVEFTDESAYQLYRPHPTHRRLADWFAKMSDVMVLDFTAVRHSRAARPSS